ncbi:MarR family winged helix-turn-helix transcriptional regulator [Nonomuraea sp. NPDC050310]|uniref:MarR family winged helix-turn-helix transcriptional regulator n=1 Tax=Nonomuraea sp. NPDC050310 TaxID=3154935 RepID=UPI00340CFC8D
MRAHPPTDEILQLDRALLALRRFFVAPPSVPDAGKTVELSTVLVVDALATQGSRGEVTIGDVARALAVTPATASRLVDRAVTSGAVIRRPSASSRRSTALDLTEEGRALYERALSYRTGRLQALLTGWNAEDRAAFVRLLSRFAEAATES